jgi:UDP-glucose 4-epimerase
VKMTLSGTKMPILGADRKWLLVGGTGRVGTLMRPHWAGCLPRGVQLVEQHRNPTRQDGLYWLPLESGLPEHCRPEAMIVLSGILPGLGNLDNNVHIGEAVLQSAVTTGVQRVLLASSQAVYKVGDGLPMAEDAPTLPVGHYGAAKLAMERAVERFRRADIDLCCLRIGNVAGADAMLINAAKATTDSPVKIDRFGTGSGPVRSYIGPATLARVLVALLLNPFPLPPVLNVAAPQPVAMADLVVATGRPFQFCPAPATAIERIILDCSLLSDMFVFSSADSDPREMVSQCSLRETE